MPEAVRSAIALGELSCVAALKNVTVLPEGGFTLDDEDVPADAEMHLMLNKQIISDKVRIRSNYTFYCSRLVVWL